MLIDYRKLAIALLIGCFLVSVLLPAVSAEIETRKELRSGDIIYNEETISVPFSITLFHKQDAAHTATGALAISPLSTIGEDGFAIAQTADETVTAGETGFFHIEAAPYIAPFEDLPGQLVGGNMSWVANTEPLRFADLPAGTGMIFPDMTLVTRKLNQTLPDVNLTGSQSQGSNRTDNSGPAASYDYVMNANNSKPYLPGNLMQAKTVRNAQGQNETRIERVPQEYMQLHATPEEIASKTMLERMWRNVHLNYNLDRAYSGETCYPDAICPMKNPLSLMPWYRLDLSVVDALNMTRPGTLLKKIMWPV